MSQDLWTISKRLNKMILFRINKEQNYVLNEDSETGGDINVKTEKLIVPRWRYVSG